MRYFSFLVAGILLISIFATVGLGKEASDINKISLDFSTPELITKTKQGETYIEIKVDGAKQVSSHEGEPMLPMYSKTIELPFGTKIKNLVYETSQVKIRKLLHKITPAPKPIHYFTENKEPEYVINKDIYGLSELYPTDWVSYYTGGGLNSNDEHKTFVTIISYPVRYNAADNEIHYVENIDIKIYVDEPEQQLISAGDDYDMVIITPSKLYDNTLHELMEHKNNHGMKTTIKTLEEIYDEYAGFDKAEQIKYFIKDAIETWGIKYVLLVGGLNSYINGQARDNNNIGSKDWYLPVRYTNNIDMGGLHDPGVISDLYYADVYDSEGNFCSWDKDKNGESDGIYAGWSFKYGKDILDFYPDVHLGRLACRNVWEVKIMTNKIINYETNTYGSDWYNKMILVAGDSFDDQGTDYIEGEVVSEKIYNSYMSDFSPTKLYVSHRNSDPEHTPVPENIVREFSSGAGHIFFDGHANPLVWDTHWQGEFEEWIGTFSVFDFPRLNNGEMLPVCLVEGCHNSQFNISMIPTLLDKENDAYTWCHGTPGPECWSWWLARKIGGGSIATIGNTGLGSARVGEHGDLDGDGILEEDVQEAFGAYYFIQFYETFSEGKQYLGAAWSGAMKKYLDTFPGMGDKTDAQTSQQMVLLGDPSLKIGGYQSSGLNAGIYNAGAGLSVKTGETVNLKAYAKNGADPYSYEWDLDGDGRYDDATGAEVTYTWDNPGLYDLSLKAKDSTNKYDIFNTIVEAESLSLKPNAPEGSSQIKPNEDYTYTASIDGYSGNVYFQFDWGDGTRSNMTDSNSATHSWDKSGSYKITARAMVQGGNQGVIVTDWSNPLKISMSKSKTINTNNFLILNRILDKFPIIKYIIEQIFL